MSIPEARCAVAGEAHRRVFVTKEFGSNNWMATCVDCDYESGADGFGHDADSAVADYAKQSGAKLEDILVTGEKHV